jgi:hypothetical protein
MTPAIAAVTVTGSKIGSKTGSKTGYETGFNTGSKRYDTVTVHSMVTDSAVLQGVSNDVLARAQQRGDTGIQSHFT